ncbi:MAG: hypothetical protein J7L08_01375 [Candidatus Aenigmarchaeota archaeon]|nr:hypothetical protein [Candidatus Aenigmarchaeota archaeon]
MELNKEQQQKIKEYLTKFMSSVDFRKEMSSREKRREFILALLPREKLKSMTELQFGDLISKLWASALWGNKEYLVQKIIDANGMDKIIVELENLLYGSESFDKRFDRFLREIKGLGPATITEVLCFYDPNKYGIWNDKARKALKILQFDAFPLAKYKISGKEYIKINNAFLEIAQCLKNLGIEDADLLAVDYFLYEVWFAEKERTEKEKFPQMLEEDKEFDHDEMRDFIRDIGNWLGFEVDTEKQIASGARVDCVWMARIANLGVVTYVFEVHKSGSIDSLILNLQKSLNNPTVQKIIAVSDDKRIEKIQREVHGLPENFRKSLTFWEVKDVINTHERLSEAMESISKLELVKSRFEEGS